MAESKLNEWVKKDGKTSIMLNDDPATEAHALSMGWVPKKAPKKGGK